MAEAAVSDKFAQVRGFQVEITGAGGKEVDTAWESVSSGLAIELTETTVGADKFTTHAPGHKSIEEITLRGAMTNGRKALCAWITETVNGRDWKRNVTITPDYGNGVPGERYTFLDCFPVRYVFPRMVVLDPNDQRCDVELVEEVTFTYRSVTVA